MVKSFRHSRSMSMTTRKCASMTLRPGALTGLFSVCTFAIHNHTNLNIGLTLTIYQSIAYLMRWVLVGAAIGLI